MNYVIILPKGSDDENFHKNLVIINDLLVFMALDKKTRKYQNYEFTLVDGIHNIELFFEWF